jgi:NitT/TauT family transport system permease protein
VSVSDTASETLLDVRVGELPAWHRWYLRNERLVLGLTGFVSILILWEVAAAAGWTKLVLLSSPSRIWRAFVTELTSGRLWNDVSVSLVEFWLGFLVASLLGIFIGIIAGWFKRANYVADPWLSALYATPDVALVPLIILWLGIGLWSKVFVVFLTALFPVAVNTLIGVQSTDARMLDVARSFGASQFKIFRTVVMPGTVPFILTGLRIASGRALVGVVLAELIAANAGIGFLISVSGVTLNTARMMVGVLLLGIFGVILGEVFRRIEQRFDVWRPQVGNV